MLSVFPSLMKINNHNNRNVSLNELILMKQMDSILLHAEAGKLKSQDVEALDSILRVAEAYSKGEVLREGEIDPSRIFNFTLNALLKTIKGINHNDLTRVINHLNSDVHSLEKNPEKAENVLEFIRNFRNTLSENEIIKSNHGRNLF